MPVPMLVIIFIGAAIAVWWAGGRLSRTTDSLSSRLNLSDAFGGLIVLAIATNLPDLAIVTTGAVTGDISLAAGSLLGGVAIQMVVLAILDARGSGDRIPLTSRTRTLVPGLEAVMVIVSLSLVVVGAQMDRTTVFRVEPIALLILLAWLAGLLLVQRANKVMAWQLAEDERRPSAGAHNPEIESSTRRLAMTFLLAAVLTLSGGFSWSAAAPR